MTRDTRHMAHGTQPVPYQPLNRVGIGVPLLRFDVTLLDLQEAKA